MGIGLALVRRLVELHGGAIAASSSGLGTGSEFTVRLPALTAEVSQSNNSATVAGDCPAASSVRPRGRRILIVEDNVDGAKSLGMLLSLDGHEIRLAHDGSSALQAAQDFRPDVVLLDIGLPRMDGYEVARRMRDRPDMQGVLLIALTGYARTDDAQKAELAGFDAHLVKPVDLRTLQSIVYGRGDPSQA
jgi:CheY-like chemotaxis protein